jgi:hypothetical protein
MSNHIYDYEHFQVWWHVKLLQLVTLKSTILAPTCISYLLFWFVQVDLTLYSILWVHPNLISKFPFPIFNLSTREYTLGLHSMANLGIDMFVYTQYHLTNLGLCHQLELKQKVMEVVNNLCIV